MGAQNSRVLLVEDEKNLAFNLQLNLKAEGFSLCCADNGKDALRIFQDEGPFAVIILDVMIPEPDGFGVAQWIRRKDNKVGILMLTARASDEDRLRGLTLGVDDYLTKPFHLGELILRVRRMAERYAMLESGGNSAKSESGGCRQAGPFRLDTENLTLEGPAGRRQLTALETSILNEFLAHPEKTLSRQYLLTKVWGLHGNLETRTVDNFILRLRKIIESNPANPKYLLSVRGKGYKLTCNPEKDGCKKDDPTPKCS